MRVLAWCLVAALCIGVESQDLAGSTVYRITPQRSVEIDLLKNLDEEHDVWKGCKHLDVPCDVMVAREHSTDFGVWLEMHGLKHNIMVPDVGALIEEQAQTRQHERARRSADSDSTFMYDVYHPLSEIEQWMVDIENSYSDLIESFEVATSYEGRSIRAFKITSGGTPNKPAIWIDGGIHAREWISPATMMFMVNELVSQYGVDPETTALLDDADIYVLPVFNVDGYVYTWTTSRMWRKTRSVNEGSQCMGCDPNRNWDYRWNEIGSSSNPCMETYAGKSPFSEIEVAMVADYVSKIHNLKAYLSYHNYGQMYMTPYGFQSVQPPDFSDLMAGCNKGLDALSAVHEMTYRCNTLYSLVGPSSGSSVDYTYGALNIKYSLGVELRDTGAHGFLLPENQIVPTGEESWAFFKAFARHVLDDPS